MVRNCTSPAAYFLSAVRARNRYSLSYLRWPRILYTIASQ